ATLRKGADGEVEFSSDGGRWTKVTGPHGVTTEAQIRMWRNILAQKGLHMDATELRRVAIQRVRRAFLDGKGTWCQRLAEERFRRLVVAITRPRVDALQRLFHLAFRQNSRLPGCREWFRALPRLPCRPCSSRSAQRLADRRCPAFSVDDDRR